MPVVENKVKVLTCSHCGQADTQVIYKYSHLGGVGMVRRPHCLDEQACWRRWDAAHKDGSR